MVRFHSGVSSEMEYLSDEELKKLKHGPLLKEERELLYLLKLFKLNKPLEYTTMIEGFTEGEIDFIEDLIHKRELLDTDLSTSLDDRLLPLKQKTEDFIKELDPQLLKNFRIILWEAE